MLLVAAAAWAGNGDGSKINPYSGEWSVTELGPKLKPGDYLALDCVINEGAITVYDAELDNQKVIPNWSSWAVGDAIDDTPLTPDFYSSYFANNTLSERKNHTFLVTEVNIKSEKEIEITGLFSGIYSLARNEDGYYEVYTADQLKAIIRAINSPKVKLMRDIDISGMGKICDTFTGTIDGSHEAIDPETGFRITAPYILSGKRGKNKGADCFLFEKVDNATFQNVAFGMMRVEDDDNDNLGIVAREAYNTLFDGVMLAGVSVFCNKDNAGGIVGKAVGCQFFNLNAMDAEITTDGVGAGTFVGNSKGCVFYNCMNNASTHVFADGRDGVAFSTNAAYSGGMTGYSDSDQFDHCMNFGWVGGNQEEVGGIVGHSQSSHILNCTNHGFVIQCAEDRFIAMIDDTLDQVHSLYDVNEWYNWVAASLTGIAVAVGTACAIGGPFGLAGSAIVAFAAIGAFATAYLVQKYFITPIFNGHDELGGIVGHAEKGTVELCSNYGFYSGLDEECGGIVGYGSYLTINNCFCEKEPGGFKNWEDTSDYKSSGTIIGSAKHCTITNCVSPTYFSAIGKESDTSAASGNIFRYHPFIIPTVGDEGADVYGPDPTQYELVVERGLMNSGLVALWLNNGNENRNQHIAPWRQNPYVPGMEAGKYDECPTLDPDHPEAVAESMSNAFHVRTPEDLLEISGIVNTKNPVAKIVLDNDLDMTGVDYEPIGRENSRFQGVFDGKGHTIKGLKISGKGDKAVGLFGVVEVLTTIKNVILAADCEISSTSDLGTGGIVGCVHTEGSWGNIIIENCGSYATINGSKKNVGGILGRIRTEGTTKEYSQNIKVYVNNCFNMGDITVENSGGALLVGYAKNHAIITNSWAAGRLMRPDVANPYPYASKDTELEYFAGYEDKISIANCYAINPYGLGPTANQNDVQRLSDSALTSGELTYMLNDNATEGNLYWFQKIGVDERPMLTSRDGEDVVYAYWQDKTMGYTNDPDLSDFDYYGPIRVSKDKSMALLEGNSTKKLTLTEEIKVGRAELNRSFKANVPTTVVLPFSTEISTDGPITSTPSRRCRRRTDLNMWL